MQVQNEQINTSEPWPVVFVPAHLRKVIQMLYLVLTEENKGIKVDSKGCRLYEMHQTLYSTAMITVLHILTDKALQVMFLTLPLTPIPVRGLGVAAVMVFVPYRCQLCAIKLVC